MTNFLRPLRPGVFQVVINDVVAAVLRRCTAVSMDIFILTSEVTLLARDVLGSPVEVAQRIAVGEFDNDFRFEITENPEPDFPSDLYFMREIATPSQIVISSWTTDRPYDAVEAAREVQCIPMEERWDLYAARGW